MTVSPVPRLKHNTIAQQLIHIAKHAVDPEADSANNSLPDMRSREPRSGCDDRRVLLRYKQRMRGWHAREYGYLRKWPGHSSAP